MFVMKIYRNPWILGQICLLSLLTVGWKNNHCINFENLFKTGWKRNTIFSYQPLFSRWCTINRKYTNYHNENVAKQPHFTGARFRFHYFARKNALQKPKVVYVKSNWKLVLGNERIRVYNFLFIEPGKLFSAYVRKNEFFPPARTSNISNKTYFFYLLTLLCYQENLDQIMKTVLLWYHCSIRLKKNYLYRVSTDTDEKQVFQNWINCNAIDDYRNVFIC